MPTLKAVRELFVIDAHEVQDRCLQVVDMNRIFDRVHGELVTFSITNPGLHAAAGHPHGKGVRMMVSPPALPILDITLNKRSAAEFSTPNHQRILQQSAFFKICNEGRTWLICVLALRVELRRQAVVLIPSGMHQLNKLHSTLNHSPCHQTVMRERSGLCHLRSVTFQNALRFV